MSKYGVLETNITEEKYLMAALKEMGYQAEVHARGAALYGYEGRERPETANVIIRRQQLDSASNDIGFARTAEGRYVARLSEYDQAIGFDQKWLNRVHQLYKEKQTIAVARAKGYVFRGREVIKTDQGERIQLRFAVR
jgi:Protein of unknown function (DUF1257)